MNIILFGIFVAPVIILLLFSVISCGAALLDSYRYKKPKN